MSVDTTVKVTRKAGFEAETETLPNNRRARQIKNRLENRLQKRLNLYLRSISITKDPVKLKVLKGKAEAISFALATVGEV